MAKGIQVVISGDGEAARRALEMVREQLRETQHESERTAEVFERAKGALESIGLYMGIREGIDFLKEFTAGAAEFGEKMQMASVKTGMTVETLSVLHYAADLAHTDFDGLQGGIGKLAVNLESAAGGNKKLAAAFQAAGIDAKQLAGTSDGVDRAFKQLSATLANTESASRRDATAKALMGKAGVELVPVLMDLGKRFDEVSAGAEKAGVKMDQLRAERLAALDDELDKLKENITGAGLAFTDGLAPGLLRVFDIISQGKGSDELFKSWGENVANIIARLTALAYDGASALERFFSVAEGGKLTDIGRRDWAAADELLRKGKELEELANGTKPAPQPKAEPKPTGRGAGAPTDPEHGASANAIAEARAQLLDESARLELAKRKAADQVQLAEWDAQHKMLLVSDQEFYAKKLELQDDEIDAEQAALLGKQKTLEDLLAKQRSDGALKRKGGVSAEELKTQRELLQVQESMATLEARRAQVGAENTATVSASQQAAELAHLRIAADLEKERGQGIAAQIALLDREIDLEAQRAKLAGGTDADQASIRAKGGVLADKLRIDEVSKQINETEADYRRRIDDTNDAASKGDISKRTAAKEIEQLNKDQVRDLKALRDAYAELANALGGDYKSKLADLDEEMTKLGRRDKSNDWQHQVADGMNSMVDTIAQQAARGKASISDMAKSMLDDMANLALKLTEQKFVAPLFEQMFTGAMTNGGGFGGSGGGASSASAAAASAGASKSSGIGGVLAQLGSAVGGFWKRPQGTFTGHSAGGTLADLAKAGAAAQQPTMPINIVDQSQRGMSVQPQQSFDGRAWVTNILMQDLDEGGTIAQAFGRTG